LNPRDPDLDEIISRLIHFPSDKFVNPPERLKLQEEMLRTEFNIPSERDL